MKVKQKSKGITLIALVITIIVLLILAGVSIATLGGENGIISRARKAKTTTEEKQAEEEAILLVNEYEMYKKMCEAEGREPDVGEFLEKNYKGKYKVEDGKYKIETESGESLEIDDKGNVKLNDEVIKANSVSSIKISGATEVEVGSNITLTVTIDENNAIYKNIEWKCNDNSKATISPNESNCVVTGVEAGKVRITCNVINYDDTKINQEYEVEIKEKSITDVTITGETSVFAGSSITLIATILPADAKYQKIEWSSNNTQIATVSGNGTNCTVTGQTNGNVVITCIVTNYDSSVVQKTYTINVIGRTIANLVCNNASYWSVKTTDTVWGQAYVNSSGLNFSIASYSYGSWGQYLPNKIYVTTSSSIKFYIPYLNNSNGNIKFTVGSSSVEMRIDNAGWYTTPCFSKNDYGDFYVYVKNNGNYGVDWTISQINLQ